MSETESSTVLEANDGATNSISCPQSPEVVTIDDDDDDDETSEIQDLRKQIRRLAAENGNQKQQITALENQLVDKNEKIETLKRKGKTDQTFYAKEFQKKIEEVKELKTDRGKLNRRIEEQDEKVAKLEKEMEGVKLELSETTQKYDEEKTLTKKTAGDLVNVRNDNETQKQEVSRLEKLLQTTEEDVNKLEKEYNEANSQQKQKIKELEDQLEKFKVDKQLYLADSTEIMEIYKEMNMMSRMNVDDAEHGNSEHAAEYQNGVASSNEMGLQNMNDSISKNPPLPESAEQIPTLEPNLETPNNHDEMEHSVVCSTCNKQFNNEDELQIHRRNKHRKSRPGPKSKTSGKHGN